MNSRIVGGQETYPNEFPSTAALIALEAKEPYCGGTIGLNEFFFYFTVCSSYNSFFSVSSRYVVTAAHCLRRLQTHEAAILVGDHNYKIGMNFN